MCSCITASANAGPRPQRDYVESSYATYHYRNPLTPAIRCPAWCCGQGQAGNRTEKRAVSQPQAGLFCISMMHPHARPLQALSRERQAMRPCARSRCSTHAYSQTYCHRPWKGTYHHGIPGRRPPPPSTSPQLHSKAPLSLLQPHRVMDILSCLPMHASSQHADQHHRLHHNRQQAATS